MEKLARFIIVTLIFVFTLVLFYSILPSIVWIFGGSFKDVAQSPIYAAAFCLLAIPFQGFLFSECFDSNFRTKS